MKLAYSKVVSTKTKHYITQYDLPIGYDFTIDRLEKLEKQDGSVRETGRMRFSLQRTRTNIKYVVECNITPYTKFATFTFAKALKDRTEVITAFRTLTRNYQRLYGEKLKYLYVIEQGKRSTKRLHIHAVIFNNRYITLTEMRKLWTHGSVRINKVDDTDNIGLYLMKYITKDMTEAKKKGYISSKALIQPQTYRLPHHIPINDTDCTYIKHYTIPLYNKKNEKVGEVRASLYEIPIN
jgi:hypothetical protein